MKLKTVIYMGFEDVLNQESKDILLVLQGLESAQRAKTALAATKKPKKRGKNDH